LLEAKVKYEEMKNFFLISQYAAATADVLVCVKHCTFIKQEANKAVFLLSFL
jgi:hypothetical protein